MKKTALLVILLLGLVLFNLCASTVSAAQPDAENGEDEMGENEPVTSASTTADVAAFSSTELNLEMSSVASPNSDHQSSTSTAASSTVDLSPDESVEKETKTKEDEEYEEDEEGDYDDQDSGPILLSQFVRRFDTSAFVPADYEAMTAELEKASSIAAETGQSLSSILSAKYRHINDTLAVINRAQAFGERLLAGSKDLKDTALYISSLLSDRMVEAKLSAQCTADIANIGRALQERKLWAAKCKSIFISFFFSIHHLFFHLFSHRRLGPPSLGHDRRSL